MTAAPKPELCRRGGAVGLPAWVAYADLALLRAEARAGCGAVVTLQSTPAQIAAGAPERHCAALRGFASSLDGEPKVLLCDPYAAAEDFGCEIEMPLDDFMVAWDNVALLMRQRKSSTPPQGRTRCSAWIRPVGTDVPGVYRLYLNGEEHPCPTTSVRRAAFWPTACPMSTPRHHGPPAVQLCGADAGRYPA
ncbi:hypothetical protein NIA69_03375 [Gemmiger formicilis]|nr:hypothetical protein [Gemmiger formicilis]